MDNGSHNKKVRGGSPIKKVRMALRSLKSIFFISSRWDLDGLHLTIMLMGRSYAVSFFEKRGMAMDKPVRSVDRPYAISVEAGKTYYWCSCDRSKVQPFCDGSHAGTGFNPVKYNPAASKTVYFCGCKQTKYAPLCDGSHRK